MILNPISSNTVFSCAADLNKVLISLFGTAESSSIDPTFVDKIVIALTRFKSAQAIESINSLNAAYAKKVRVSKMWVDVRGDLKSKNSTSFPFTLKHQLYKEKADFIEGIPEKHKKLVLDKAEEEYTVLNFVNDVANIAEVYGCMLYGVYREDVSCSEASHTADETRKILNFLITSEKLDTCISAAISINFFIVEGKSQ